MAPRWPYAAKHTTHNDHSTRRVARVAVRRACGRGLPSPSPLDLSTLARSISARRPRRRLAEDKGLHPCPALEQPYAFDAMSFSRGERRRRTADPRCPARAGGNLHRRGRRRRRCQRRPRIASRPLSSTEEGAALTCCRSRSIRAAPSGCSSSRKRPQHASTRASTRGELPPAFFAAASQRLCSCLCCSFM